MRPCRNKFQTAYGMPPQRFQLDLLFAFGMLNRTCSTTPRNPCESLLDAACCGFWHYTFLLFCNCKACTLRSYRSGCIASRSGPAVQPRHRYINPCPTRSTLYQTNPSALPSPRADLNTLKSPAKTTARAINAHCAGQSSRTAQVRPCHLRIQFASGPYTVSQHAHTFQGA